jgi:hypothetical protein
MTRLALTLLSLALLAAPLAAEWDRALRMWKLALDTRSHPVP